MKRVLLILSVCLALSGAAAQDTAYVGVRLAAGTQEGSFYFFAEPYVGLQVGVRVLPLELRVAYDVSLGVYSALADLLYTRSFEGGPRAYAGAGLEHHSNDWTGQENYSFHATAGAEYRSGIVGFFAEAQPAYVSSVAPLRVRIGLGVNFYVF